MEDIVRRLASTSVVIGNLPELPGYNGSVLAIDDEEAARCVADIDAGVAEITRLRAAAPAWQPIETAPKDGTHLIVSNESVVWCNVKWVKRPRAGERWEHFALGALRFNPTHWMPLPPAPDTAKEEA